MLHLARRNPRSCFAATALALGLCWPSCLTLEVFDTAACGNGFLEPGEDCDYFDATADGTSCIAPGAPNACRYTCEPFEEEAAEGESVEPAGACPAGWSCGHDRVCRRASGAFGEPVRIANRAEDEVLVGDVDGDGYDDVVSIGPHELRVQYVGPDVQSDDGGVVTEATLTLTLTRADARPSLGDLGADGLADLVVGVGDGLGVYQGASDRTLVPTLQLTLVEELDQPRVMAVDLVPDVAGEEILIQMAGGVWVLERSKAELKPVTMTTPVEGSLEDLAAPPASLPLWRPPAGEGEQLGDRVVVGFAGDEVVYVLAVSPSEQGFHAVAEQVSLDGASLTGGLLVLRVDVDEHLDMLVGSDDGVYVAYGLGNGHFHSSVPELGTEPDGRAGRYSGCTFPVAAGHLDGDDVLDWVGRIPHPMDGPGGVPRETSAVWLSSKGGCEGEPTLVHPSGGVWDEVVLGDFNGDGRLDLVGGSHTGAGLDLLRGTGGATMNRVSLSTDGGVSNLQVGDFDGDTLADVAALIEGADEGRDVLAVLFGQYDGVPQGPVACGSVDEAVQLVTGRLLEHDEPVVDAIDDLVLVGVRHAAEGPSEDDDVGFGLLLGRGDRQLISPLLLVEPGTGATGIVREAIAAAHGRFRGQPPRSLQSRDIAVLTSAEDEAAAVGLLAIAPREEAELFFTQAPVDTGFINTQGVVMEPVDLDADGTEELVLMGASSDGQAAQLRLARVGVGDDADALDVEVLDGLVAELEDSVLNEQPLPVGVGGELAASWPQRTRQLGSCALATGASEVVVHALDVAGSEPTTVIYLLRGEGLLGGEVLGRQDADVVRPPEGSYFVASACANLDADEAQELVVLTVAAGAGGVPPMATLLVYERGADGALVPWPEAIGALSLRGQGGELTLRDLRTGDLNADGIDDLVVVARERILALVGRPVAP